jgi:hypothetical protein
MKFLISNRDYITDSSSMLGSIALWVSIFQKSVLLGAWDSSVTDADFGTVEAISGHILVQAYNNERS